MSSDSSETEAFCGFEETRIKKFSKIDRNKLDILQWELGDSASFWGFESLDIRKYEKINKCRISILTRSKKPMDISSHSDQITSKTTKLVAPHGRTAFSAGLGRRFKIPPLNDQNLHKPPGLVILGNSCYECSNVVSPFSGSSDELFR